jgi:molybdopterin-containing oxidoreductase family iron-sulfur binding subunit
MSSLSGNQLQRWREQVGEHRGEQYWRSLDELAGSDEFQAFMAAEFPALSALWETPVSRREMLKYMGASLALAGLSGCGRQPTEDIVPYVNMPERVLPGKPRFYATTAQINGYAHGVLAESHTGRPTRLEGNPDHPANLGACDPVTQASILGLYDPDRSNAVRERATVSGYGALLAALSERQREWDANDGAGLCLLTGTLTSPSAAAAIDELLERWPQARWYAHEPIDRSGVYTGSRMVFGQPLEPVYDFTQARAVLALDGDFMQAQPGFLRYAHDFMARRRPRDQGTDLARLYAAVSTPTPPGAVAAHRLARAGPRIEALARQLARALGVEVAAPPEPAAEAAWVEAVAGDLRQQGGAAVVVPGDQQSAAVHAIAQAINHRLGAYGRTVRAIPPVPASQQAGTLAELTRRLQQDSATDVVVLDTNPVYSAAADLEFEQAFRRAPWRLHWGASEDETAQLAHWHVPATHALETWGDARAFDGTVSLSQPLIESLHGGRTLLEMLHALTTGTAGEARQLLRSYWQQRYGGGDFETFWRRSLHDGVVANSAARPAKVSPRNNWQQALPQPQASGDALILQTRPDPALGEGGDANNGWLQELPRPLTKLTWTNAVLMAPALAAAHGLANGAEVRVSAGGRQLAAPVYVLPGMPGDAITLELGFGREHAGRVGTGVGVNAYRLRTSQQPAARPAKLEPTGEHWWLADTQNHHVIEGRDLIRAADLEHYRDNPDFAQQHPPEHSFYPEQWPAPREAEHAWGMVLDLSACIGCNACVTACQGENNIPVVGPEEVARGHEMHWIRIDRYFKGAIDGPGMVFQPVTCMHCENAPCEYVCPVAATQHSASGLNEMIYNRCIGTRYCSQNCPYKVRRFNWFDYVTEDSRLATPQAAHNPDVTVRSRGVMEKCTYCVQRINAVRHEASVQDRAIQDGEIQTACQQACPTQAIVFGDLADGDSHVHALTRDPLNYSMLGGLNTRPRTTYLAAVRNPNPDLPGEA